MPKLVRQVYTSPATGIFAPVFREKTRNEVHFLYSEQHEVITRWGHFLLDNAAYAAYLEGKLWINWGTDPAREKKIPASSPKAYIPLNVSEEAIRLRDAAAHQDVYLLLQQQFPGASVPLPYKNRMRDLSIEEMNLSVRSSNALMRANARTFERVMEIMQMEDGFKRIRNLGIKSEKEIVRNFFSACYANLSQGEQAVFWQKVIENRKNL